MSSGYVAARDHVVELARAQDVLGGELVLPGDAPRLPHPDRHAALGEVRPLEAGHVLAQERGDLPHLPARLPLRQRQIPHVGAEHAGDPRAVDATAPARAACRRRGCPRAAAPARPPRVACRTRSHRPCTPRHWSGCAWRVGREGVPLELHHAEHQRHRLHEAVARAADLEGRPRQGGHVAVAGAVHDGPGHDDDRPRLGLEHHAVGPRRADDAAGEGVEQDAARPPRRGDRARRA